MYSQHSKPSRWIILQGNSSKFIWDLYIVSVLILVAFVVPYRLAFAEVDSDFWLWTYQTIDLMFLVDIIITFFSSIQTDDNSEEITDFKLIAIAYIKSWFFFDVISILPIDYFME
jgi:potassium voltage-gated channel Eag-related subfamily H protein 7